jgi:non-homologous end joining protein Ku
VKYGLKERYPDAVKIWERRTNEFVRQMDEEMAIKQKEFRKQMKIDSPKLLRAVESMIIDNILSVFP